MTGRCVRFVLATAALAVSVAPAYGQSQKSRAGIEPRAEQALRRMSDFLAEQPRFSVQASTRVEDASRTTPEQRQARVDVERPNKLRADWTRDGEQRHLFYDGQNFTIMAPGTNTYATTPAPPTLDQTLEVVGQKLDVYPPGADLLASDPFAVLTEQAESGTWLGEEQMDGVTVDRIGLRGPIVDSEIWIERGQRPVPRRYEVISKDVPGKPRYVVELKDWDFAPTFEEDRFAFRVPEGAQRVPFLAARQQAERQRSERRGVQP
jgi:hypothetical protein